jgi:hypothetical protein
LKSAQQLAAEIAADALHAEWQARRAGLDLTAPVQAQPVYESVTEYVDTRPVAPARDARWGTLLLALGVAELIGLLLVIRALSGGGV